MSDTSSSLSVPSPPASPSASSSSIPRTNLHTVCKFGELLTISRRELDLRRLVDDFQAKPSEPHRKDAVETIRSVLEKDLFVYDRLDIQLPPTVFNRPNLAFSALSVPLVSADQEVKQLAFESDFSAEMPMLRVTRLTTSYSPFLKLRIEGAKNAAWTMRDCHAFVNGEGFWDVLKQTYGSFQVSAVRSTLYPVHLNESLLTLSEFNTSSAVDSPVVATLSTNPAVKTALNKLKAGGDPQFEIQLRFRAQESNQQLLLCAFSVRASQLLLPDENLATPQMAEKPTAPVQTSQQEQQRRKLSPLQLQQVWESGQFEVPSKLFPGTSHVWELSRLLLGGARLRTAALLDVLAFATHQIYEVRERVANRHNFLDLRSTLRSIKNGLLDMVGSVVGVPQRQQLFNNDKIESMISEQRLWHLLNSLKLKPEGSEDSKSAGNDADWVDVEGVKEIVRVREARWRELLPFALTSEENKELCVELCLLKFPLAKERLGFIFEDVERQWRKDRLAFATSEELKIRAASPSSSSSSSSLEEKKILEELQDALADEFNRRCFTAIESDLGLASFHRRLPQALSKLLRAVLVIRQEQQIAHEHQSLLLREFESKLEASHPIRCRIHFWKRAQIENFKKGMSPQAYVTKALPRLDPSSAIILRTNLDFDNNIAPGLRTQLQAHSQASQEFIWRARIWKPQNWTIIKGGNSYRAVTDVESRVSSGHFGWRLRNVVQGTLTCFNNFNFVVVACLLLNGPLSLKALCKKQAFTPGWRINQDTGVLEKDPSSTQQTLMSRLSALWKHARNSRNSFEAQADTGLLGKSVTRWFSRFWNWGIVAGVGSLLVGTIMPPLCVLCSSVCLVAAIASPVLVPFGMLLRYVSSVFLYDWDRMRGQVHQTWGSLHKSTQFPLPAALLHIFFGGIVQPILAVFCMLILHPGLASLAVLFGSIRWLCFYLWDRSAYSLLVRPLARVPVENGFLQRRVAGPGLSWSWFHQVSVGEALLALRGHLERLQLGFFEAHVTAIVDAPIKRAEQVLRELFGPFSAYVSPAVAVSGMVGRAHERRQTQFRLQLDARRKQFPVLKEAQRMRMTDVDLQDIIRRGARLVEQFMNEGVFPSLSQERIAQWWSEQKLEPDSWVELTRQLLRSAISTQFTETLAESDKIFRFATEQVGMQEFLTMVEGANPRDHLDKVTAVVGRVSQAKGSLRELNSGDLSLVAPQDFSLGRYPSRNDLDRSHRVFLRALRGDKPKEKEDDDKERKELASKLSVIVTVR